jgi:hypothetical protein
VSVGLRPNLTPLGFRIGPTAGHPPGFCRIPKNIRLRCSAVQPCSSVAVSLITAHSALAHAISASVQPPWLRSVGGSNHQREQRREYRRQQ